MGYVSTAWEQLFLPTSISSHSAPSALPRRSPQMPEFPNMDLFNVQWNLLEKLEKAVSDKAR